MPVIDRSLRSRGGGGGTGTGASKRAAVVDADGPSSSSSSNLAVISSDNATKSNTSNDKKASSLSARLSDRRRQRREQRLGKGNVGPTSTNRRNEVGDDDQRQQQSGNGAGTSTGRNTRRIRRAPLKSKKKNKKPWMRYSILALAMMVSMWLLAFIFLAQKTNMNNDHNKHSKGIFNFSHRRQQQQSQSQAHRPFEALRNRFNGFINSDQKDNTLLAGGGKLDMLSQFLSKETDTQNFKQVRGDESTVIDMRELNAHLVFDDKNGGAWTQGFHIDPVPIGNEPNGRPLRIFVVPHSHCDPGWIKTFDDYFQSETKQILSTVIQALHDHPERKFIWAEISYFEWWWREQTLEVQEETRKLIEKRQFEFVTGGWVQPDEANTQLYAMEIQLQEGHDFIRNTFGKEYIPKYGWSIDPFGYSPTMAYLLKKYDFQAMLIQRVHYRIKKELAQKKHLEFMWRQTWDTTGDYDIFTHVMPFYSYDVPHTCGPNPKICCQFDFARIRGTTKFVGNCPWGTQPEKIHDLNVENRAMMLLDQYRQKANLYQSNVVIAPLGDDFRYRTKAEADIQFENYQRIFDYINTNVDGVEISFGTLSEYFQAAMGTFTPPILKGAFFTYADREQDYWSGYFTSRIFDKALDRQLERELYAATSLGADKQELQEPRRALSLFQHHDGVTGTAKTHVVEDYARKIHDAIRQCQETSLSILRRMIHTADGSDITDLQSCWQSNAPRGLSQNLCGETGEILVYNPLETIQFCGNVAVSGGSAVKASLPCEKPGSVPNSKANIQFDSNTGLMTHPVKEQWMVWKVKSGGAYLFFPGKIESFEEEHVIEQGGFVVKTKHWKRTVVEKTENIDGSTTTVLDFVYETFLQNPNEEWFVRFSVDSILNEGIFHTDLNGYNFDTHHFRSDMPIQSQVFPMPTLASIEDANQRLTVLSEHAQGTASIEEGTVDIWLDRRLAQDDQRGLGQGVMDNVPTRTRLRVLLEKDGYEYDNPEFSITQDCKRQWKELNHPLEMYGRLDGSKLLPMPDLKPEDTNQKVRRYIMSGKYIIPPVFMVYNRADYLKEAIDSLRNSDFPRDKIPIIISHDGHIDTMTDYVESIKSDFDVIQIYHPHACSEHPHSFPGDDPSLNLNYPGDSYGNPRNSKITCCKHHFTWMMNEVFKMEKVKDAHGFLFLEEDYIVAPTIFETIQHGLSYLNNDGRGRYFGLTLDPTEGFSFKPPGTKGWIEKHFVTGPMVIQRYMFEKIQEHALEYCTFDEYNWDWSIVHLMGRNLLPYLVLTPRRLQVAHIGLKGGLHEDSISEAKEMRMKRVQELHEYHGDPKQDGIGKYQPLRKVHEEGFGGWGHPEDHRHCAKLFGIELEPPMIMNASGGSQNTDNGITPVAAKSFFEMLFG